MERVFWRDDVDIVGDKVDNVNEQGGSTDIRKTGTKGQGALGLKPPTGGVRGTG